MEKIVDRGLVFLIVFPVVAFGAVQPWSMAITEIVAFLAGAAGFLLYPLRQTGDSLLPPSIKWFVLLFLVVIVLSIVPLPESLLSFVAPGTASLYRSLDDGAPGLWRTLSMTPHETMSGLWLILACAAVFRTVAVHTVKKEQVTRIVRTMMMTGTGLAVFAVVQKLFWTGKIYWFYPVADRATPFGPFINRNHGAAFLGMIASVSVAAWLYEMVKLEKRTQAPAMSLRGKAYALLNNSGLKEMSLGLVSAMICAGGLFLSLSRGAMLSFAIAAGLFLLIARSRRSLRRKAIYIGFISLLLFLLIVAAGWSVIAGRLETITQERPARLPVWADSLSLIKESPVIGTGIGTFARRFPRHQSGYGWLLFEHAENEYLELLIETGVVGLMAVIGSVIIFGTSVYKRWRERKDSFVVIMGAGFMTALVMPLLHSFVDFHLIVPAIAMLFSILAGLLYATVFSVAKDRMTTIQNSGSEIQ